MLSASTNFKNYIQENGREIALRISWDAIVLQSADIKSCVKWFDGELYTSVMQGIELEVEGVYDMKGKSLLVEFGVSYNGSAIEWLTWGTFLVKNHWNLAESKSTKIEAFDAMLKSHIAYDLTPTYPITVGNYLQAICTRLGITLATPTFTNSTVSIPDEKYAMLDNIIYRDVLHELAEVAGGIIHIRANGQMAVKYPTATSESLNSNVKTVDVEKLFGEVNTLVLATTPAEDNTLREDLVSVASYGRHEVRFEDNQIMVLTPDSYIDNLFNQIKYTKYYPFELDSFGYGYFEVGDIINVIDENDVSYQTIVLGGSITIDGGFTEMMYAKVPDMATTPDYDNAHRTLSPRETAIILNRQARRIELRAAEIAAYADDQIILAVGTAVKAQDSMVPYTQADWEVNAYSAATGLPAIDSTYIRTLSTLKIPIQPSIDVVLSCSPSLDYAQTGILFYNASDVFLSYSAIAGGKRKITTPATASYFRFRARKVSATSFTLAEMPGHYVRVVPVSTYLKGARYEFLDTYFAIKNVANEPVLTADIDGNLEVIGKVTSTSGKIGGMDISANGFKVTRNIDWSGFTSADETRLSEILAELVVPTAQELIDYDLNFDGELSITDLVLMSRVVDDIDPSNFSIVFEINSTEFRKFLSFKRSYESSPRTFINENVVKTGEVHADNVQASQVIIDGKIATTSEQDTWIPVLIGTTTAGTGTYTTQTGKYTKIGNVVNFNIHLAWTAHTGTGNMEVTLPFTNGDTFCPVTVVPSALTYSNQLGAMVIASSNRIRFYTYASNTMFGAGLAMDTSATLYISGSYRV